MMVCFFLNKLLHLETELLHFLNVCSGSTQDSGRNGTHLPGHHSLGYSPHRGGRHVSPGTDQWWPQLPPEGNVRGGVSALDNCPAAGQDQRYSADASLR